MENTVSPFDEGIKVLLIEDSPTDAELVKITLSEEYSNLNFKVVDTGEQLKESLTDFQPQMIISDYSLPGFSGMEALSICRTLKPELPFIFVSGTIGEERAVEALKRGATDYVLKGNLARLPHALQQAISGQREKRNKERQQEELARTYELLNSVFDTTHMMVAYMDTSFNFIQVNRAFAEACGNEQGYFAGKSFFKLFSDPNMLSAFNEVVRQGKTQFEYGHELTLDHVPRAEPLVLDWSLAPTLSYGVVEGVVFTALDVSEKLKKEQQALESQKRFQDALNHAPDAVIITNSSGEIVFFSEEAETYFGYSHNEILGKKVEVLIPARFAQDHVKKRDDYSEKPTKRAVSARNDLLAKRKDGSEFPVDINLGPLDWEGGVGTIVMLRDITEKKAKEKELRLLSNVASHIDNAVYIGDKFLHAKWVNESFTALTGYELDDLKGKSPAEVYTNGKGNGVLMIESMIDQLEQGNYMHQEMVLARKDGSEYWCSIHATPILNEEDDLKQVIAIMNDISVRKEAEMERDHLMLTLEEKVEDRTQKLKAVNGQLEDWKKDISSSITYAKYIQNAFLPDIDSSALGVNDAFIMDIPKDVLSGDFHWSYRCTDTGCTYVALGDCTGHGVPGSMMTVLAVQLLESQVVGSDEKQQPKNILAEVDKRMYSFLNPSGAEVKVNDGMEVVLLRIDHRDNSLVYSTAGRPFYHYRSDERSLVGHKHNKLTVGGLVNERTKEFEDYLIPYNKGDRFYAFSDGFADQFGGKSGKKMMRGRKEKLLEELQVEPFEKHADRLKDFFCSWKGEKEQIDDVIVLGLEP